MGTNAFRVNSDALQPIGDLYRQLNKKNPHWKKTVTGIEEHHRCFGLGGYFMAAVLAAASYSRIGFSIYFAVRARHVRFPGGSKFHLEPGTITGSWVDHQLC